MKKPHVFRPVFNDRELEPRVVPNAAAVHAEQLAAHRNLMEARRSIANEARMHMAAISVQHLSAPSTAMLTIRPSVVARGAANPIHINAPIGARNLDSALANLNTQFAGFGHPMVSLGPARVGMSMSATQTTTSSAGSVSSTVMGSTTGASSSSSDTSGSGTMDSTGMGTTINISGLVSGSSTTSGSIFTPNGTTMMMM